MSVEDFRTALGRFIVLGVRQRIYGELVSPLADRGDLETAIAIEAVGHQLAHTRRIPVLCGYHAAGHHPLTPDAIRSIAAVHDRSWSEGEPEIANDSLDEDALATAARFTPYDFMKAGTHSRRSSASSSVPRPG